MKKKQQPKRFTHFVLLIYDIAYSKFIWSSIIFACFHMCDSDVIISPSIGGQVQLSSTGPLKLGFLNSERTNFVKFETS